MAPLLLLLAFGVVGTGRVVQAQAGVAAVASEAARAGALASTGEEAVVLGTARGWAVARGYWLTNGSLRLTLDAGAFGRGGEVRAVAAYEVALGDVPLLGRPSVAVASEHVEPIDPYRSGVFGGRR